MNLKYIITTVIMLSFCSLIAQDITTKDFLDKRLAQSLKVFRAGSLSEVDLHNETLRLSEAVQYEKGIALSNMLIGNHLLSNRNLDSALQFFKEAHHFSEYVDDYYKCQINKFLGAIYGKVNNADSAKFYYKLGLQLAEENKYDTLIIQLNNQVGLTLIKQGKYAEAGKYVEQAYQWSKESGIDKFLGSIYARLSQIYRTHLNWQEALKIDKKAIDYYKERGGTDSELFWAYMAPAFYYNDTNSDSNSALFWYNKARPFASSPINRGILYVDLSQIFLRMEKYDSAEKYIDMGVSLMKKSFPSMVSTNYMNKAEILLGKGQLDSAYYYANQFLSSSKYKGSYVAYHYFIEIYKTLAKIKDGMGDYDSALYYSEKHRVLNDSISKIKNTQKVNTLIGSIQFMDSEKELYEVESQATLNRTVTVIITIVSILSIFLLVLTTRIIRTHIKRNRLKVELERNRLELSLKDNKKVLDSYTNNMLKKNQLLDELKETAMNAQSDANEWAKIEHEIKQYKQNGEEWTDFISYFNSVYAGFFERLRKREPDLSDSEMRLAALVKLNLSLKESSQVLGINTSSVKISRTRLKKKLGLQNEENLNQIISEI